MRKPHHKTRELKTKNKTDFGPESIAYTNTTDTINFQNNLKTCLKF